MGLGTRQALRQQQRAVQAVAAKARRWRRTCFRCPTRLRACNSAASASECPPPPPPSAPAAVAARGRAFVQPSLGSLTAPGRRLCPPLPRGGRRAWLSRNIPSGRPSGIMKGPVALRGASLVAMACSRRCRQGAVQEPRPEPSGGAAGGGSSLSDHCRRMCMRQSTVTRCKRQWPAVAVPSRGSTMGAMQRAGAPVAGVPSIL